jgi:hypothetical protein
MNKLSADLSPKGLRLVFAWHRILISFFTSIVLFLFLSLGWQSPKGELLIRILSVAFVAMLVFGLFEQWPRNLPKLLPRWFAQAAGVALSVPMTVITIYLLSPGESGLPFWEDRERFIGLMSMSVSGLFLAPWVVMSALVQQREIAAKNQALAFELERSELERNALDARYRLLQAQVEPHFLFNTLANIRALVYSGSPKAPLVLDSLISYLRAAVPRINQANTTLEQELNLVKAYLQIMNMRMSDRMSFSIEYGDSDLGIYFPPMTLLTLVENSIRHGIDPCEAGGSIDVLISQKNGRCMARIMDTGVGFRHQNDGLGTGLSTLKERIALAFSEDASLRVFEILPHGVCAEINIPIKECVQ